MSITTLHPLFSAMQKAWEFVEDCYEGEDAIKAKGKLYLPYTPGQIEDGANVNTTTKGYLNYLAYKTRAKFPDIYKDAVQAAIGVMHREPAQIDLPSVLEPLRENATHLNESLQLLLRKINTEQLVTGRLGLLGDIKVGAEKEVQPVLVMYKAQSVRNWDDSNSNMDDIDLRLVVLDESGYEMGDDFSWDFKTKHRVLAIVDDQGNIVDKGKYSFTVVSEQEELNPESYTELSLRGNTTDKIPFVFINCADLSPTPDNPPMYGLAKDCLSIYLGEADYRQHLFAQSQDTLVVIGSYEEDEDTRLGAGAKISVPIGGDAKFIGVSSQGLPEQRQALENDYKRAVQKSGQLLDSTSRAKESGDALRIRIAAQTATLPQIALTGAAALEKVLRTLAQWYGADPEEVKVTPNLKFSESDLNGQTIVQLLQAKSSGAPISNESIHAVMAKQGFTEKTFEQELELIANEEPRIVTPVSPVDDPEEDPDADN